MKFIRCSIFVLFCSLWGAVFAQTNTYVFADRNRLMPLDGKVKLLTDFSNTLSVEEVSKQQDKFQQFTMLNKRPSSATVWVHLSLKNNTEGDSLYLVLAQPSIEYVSLYKKDDAGNWQMRELGKYKKFSARYLDNPNYIFPLSIRHGETRDLYLQIESKDQLQVPMFVGTQKMVLNWEATRAIFFGIYCGVILIMIAYHFFIFLSTRNQAYFSYVLFIAFVGLVQIDFQGYAFQFLWPESPWMALNSSFLLPIGSGLATAFMVKKFLKTRFYTPELDKGINFYIVLSIIAGMIGLFGYKEIAVLVLQTLAFLGAIYAIIIAFVVIRKHYRPARFFFIAFLAFLLCILIFVLRNFGFIPYNLFTSYILEIGSVIQTTLLSFALADQINVYRKEKEISQEHALRVMAENERITKEQNILLEEEVKKRTTELQQSNESLEIAVYDLKHAQKQLVEAEKLASLGVLTAGIAHEINNPINFVSSNVRPLRRDITILFTALTEICAIYFSPLSENEKREKVDKILSSFDIEELRIEILELIEGIEEGASRTTSIVKSLRIFSHEDGKDLKPYDINKGITSTLAILDSLINDTIDVTLDLGTLPPIECFPGKMNQSFMNMLSNAVAAIKQKFGSETGGTIHIKTYFDENSVYISIKDNGVGIEEEIKDKIYDPFFTTQDVGEGVGLGLSIVYQTITMHGGTIVTNSQVGEGTEFLIELPWSRVDSFQDRLP